jgi:hypothetical protein
LPFQPPVAGLINLVVNGIPTGGPPPPPEHGEPRIMSLKVEVFAPGNATPVFSQTGFSVTAPDSARLIWVDLPASADQLSGGWNVTVSNTGSVASVTTVVVRYQVQAGNLGKVDHILVLMQENRSFDHMLGYLKITGANPRRRRAYRNRVQPRPERRSAAASRSD